jgi:hypothetical protein
MREEDDSILNFRFLSSFSLFFFKSFGFLFSFYFIFQCHPADPDFRVKPLQNREYTGFISREFFQVIVEVNLPEESSSIEKLRENCLSESIPIRDKLTLPILREIASNNIENRRFYKEDEREREENQILSSFEKKTVNWRRPASKEIPIINPFIYRGEFAWFLDKMFLFQEDYSKSGKCKFIYRNIGPELFKKVYETRLSIPTKEIQRPVEVPSKNDRNNTTPGSPVIPTGGMVR